MLANDERILKEQGAVTKISAVYPQGMFMSERSLEVEQIKTKFPKFLKVLQILTERGEWILTRIFEDPKGSLQERAFGVWLCINFQWECFIVDDCIKVDESSLPLFTYHSGIILVIQATKNGQTFYRRQWLRLQADTNNWHVRNAQNFSLC